MKCKFSWASSIEAHNVPIYMSDPYQSLMASNDGAATRLLKCFKDGAELLLPMLVREIGSGFHEAYSAYGYGGFWGSGQLSDSDVDELKIFLAGEAIVAIFIRHSPFLANQLNLPVNFTELNRHTYAVELNPAESFDQHLQDIPQKLRWSVNYASRAGLSVLFNPLSECSESRLKEFYKLYMELMLQKGALGYTLFSEKFFIDHARKLGAQSELAEVVDNTSGELLAGAFFLVDQTGWVHYHLSAAQSKAMKLQAMELLISSAIFRYGNSRYNALHLGGGHSLDETDGLSRFKSKFATQRLEFYCSKLICDEANYRKEYERLPLAHPNYFLINDARGL